MKRVNGKLLKSINRVVVSFAVILAVASQVWAITPPINNVKFAIEPQFDVAADFAAGLARVGFAKKTAVPNDYALACGYKDIERYGYINKSGTLVIPATFTAADNFAEGLAAVRMGSNGQGTENRFGYIDRTGKMVIPAQFLSAGRFSAGLAPVTTATDRGYIDRTGKIVLKLTYQSFTEFQEGLAWVGIETNATQEPRYRYGYINRQGKLVIPARFTKASNFSQGLAAVETSQHRGYINKRGRFAIENPQLDIYVASEFHEGMIASELGGGACSAAAYCEYVYLDRRGKVVIQPPKPIKFTAAGYFAGGLAPVATSGGGRDAGGFYPASGWGFINQRGKFIIQPQFDDAGSFVEGLAAVSVNGKYGYISPPAP